MKSLMKDVFYAMKELPAGVFIWVNFVLTPVVLAPWIWIFFDRHPVIVAAAIANVVVIIPNMYFLWRQRGISKILSVSHLVWIPLVVYLGHWLFDGKFGGPLTPENGAAFYAAWVMLVILSISLIFDIYDSVRYLRGNREVLRGPEE